MSHPTVERVLRLCIGRLENEMWTEADDLNDCDESETALSLICDELTANNVSITAEIHRAIQIAAKDLGLGDSSFPQIEALVRD